MEKMGKFSAGKLIDSGVSRFMPYELQIKCQQMAAQPGLVEATNQVVEKATALLGKRRLAGWFGTPKVGLGGESPAEAMLTLDGCHRVSELLGQIHSNSGEDDAPKTRMHKLSTLTAVIGGGEPKDWSLDRMCGAYGFTSIYLNNPALRQNVKVDFIQEAFLVFQFSAGQVFRCAVDDEIYLAADRGDVEAARQIYQKLRLSNLAKLFGGLDGALVRSIESNLRELGAKLVIKTPDGAEVECHLLAEPEKAKD